MNNAKLKISQTERTPLMTYDPKTMVFHMRGVSVPDNAKDFYAPIHSWLTDLVHSNQNGKAEVHVDIDYFSIQSAKEILSLLRNFERMPGTVIYWYYDDPDTKEIGEDFNSMLKVPMQLIEKD